MSSRPRCAAAIKNTFPNASRAPAEMMMGRTRRLGSQGREPSAPISNRVPVEVTRAVAIGQNTAVALASRITTRKSPVNIPAMIASPRPFGVPSPASPGLASSHNAMRASRKPEICAIRGSPSLNMPTKIGRAAPMTAATGALIPILPTESAPYRATSPTAPITPANAPQPSADHGGIFSRVATAIDIRMIRPVPYMAATTPVTDVRLEALPPRKSATPQQVAAARLIGTETNSENTRNFLAHHRDTEGTENIKRDGKRCSVSFAANGEAVEAESGRGDGTAEFEIVADLGNVLQHVFQIAGDGDLFDRVGAVAAGDPKTAGPAGIVAGDEIHPEAHKFCDVKAFRNGGDDLLGRFFAGLQEIVASADARGSSKTARRVPRGLHSQFFRGVGVQKIGLEDTVVDHDGAAGGNAFAVKGAGAEAAGNGAVIDDSDVFPGDLFT